MGNIDRQDPAWVIRTLIDIGEVEGTLHPLPAPWDTLRSVILAVGPRRSLKIEAFATATRSFANRDEILWRVNQADLVSEPPLPYPEYPTTFAEDLPVWNFIGAGKEEENQMEDRYLPTPDPQEPKQRQTLLHHAFEAYRPLPPTRWLVEGVVSQGSLNLLVGEGGSKKTYAMMDLAICVALGKPWLGFQTQQTPVIWVDEESGEIRMLRRLRQAMRGHQAPPELPFYFTSLSQFNLRNAEDAKVLISNCFQQEAGLVVIDALADVMPGADENSVRDVVPVFQQLRQICEMTGAAVIVIHHANKSGGYRGSSHMRGAVELMLMVHSKSKTPFIEFQSTKTRDTGGLSFAARIHFEPDNAEADRVWLTRADESEALRGNKGGDALNDANKYVLGFLKEHGEGSRQALMQENSEFKLGYIDKALGELRNMGLIRRISEGGKGKIAVYALSNKKENYLEEQTTNYP